MACGSVCLFGSLVVVPQLRRFESSVTSVPLAETAAVLLNFSNTAVYPRNHAKPKLCPCTSPYCISFTGDCRHQMRVDCRHFEYAPATVVTAFWHLRPDRPLSQWREWIRQTHMLNASLVSFMPASLIKELRELRTGLGLKSKTCLISMGPEQLPYSYLEPRIRSMLADVLVTKRNRHGRLYPSWNWESPEWTNSQYVHLQSGKVAVLDAVRQLKLIRGGFAIWIDAGLSRHVDVTQELSGWPAVEQISQLSQDKIYIASWAGYPPMHGAVQDFCAEPEAEFLLNRNHLSGTVVVASERALVDVFLPWSFMLEQMVEAFHWNNEQVMWELLICFFPNIFSVLDSHGVLFKELSKPFGHIHKVNFDFPHAGMGSFSNFWYRLSS